MEGQELEAANTFELGIFIFPALRRQHGATLMA